MIPETAKMPVCTAQMIGRLIVPSLSTMRPELTGCSLRMCNVFPSVATGSLSRPLRPRHRRGW